MLEKCVCTVGMIQLSMICFVHIAEHLATVNVAYAVFLFVNFC